MAEDDTKFEAVRNHQEQQLLEKEEAGLFIQQKITEAGQLGANDSEIPELFGLLEKLGKGEISSHDARAEATAIVARKNPYH
jgi:hypothetical protein